MQITSPGVYDIPADIYHADPVLGGSLSSSGARKLLLPSCPALFRYERDHGQGRKREFDIGTAAHTLLFGSGPELHVVDADNYLTKAAKTDRDAAYARGDVPLLPVEFDAVQAMVAVVREHSRASDLLADGLAEQSLFWTDPVTDVPCRARLDWLSSDAIVDYKTTTSVEPGHIARSVAEYGYHCQADWYLTGAVELDLLPPDAPFWFIFQAKTPPYLVTVVELDDVALKIGRERNELAREIFRDCTAADAWPAYSDDIELISLPAYATRRHYEGILL